jgi:lysyl-tRNA synthetase class I
MKKHLLSAIQIAALKKHFERCKNQILALDWVTQGSLSQSPQGNWRWTRKVKAKTVTVALSDQQAELFRQAIDDHRQLEKLIDQMRSISQQVLLNSVQGPARRKRRTSS